jgi:hypothetical protein
MRDRGRIDQQMTAGAGEEQKMKNIIKNRVSFIAAIAGVGLIARTRVASGISKSRARVVAAGWLQRIPSDYESAA